MRGLLTVGCVVVALTLGACAGARIPAPRTGADVRPVDEPCNAANTRLEGATRMMSFDPIEFAVPARWIPEFKSLNDLDFNLQRTERRAQRVERVGVHFQAGAPDQHGRV
ncbi:MAG: hypothetical protein U5K74_15145 [Gemmatimonadaceae bacterium]|nr:hypothetical protein [Gemmatimonadaceae bacterium]